MLKPLPGRAHVHIILFPASGNNANTGPWLGGMFMSDEATNLWVGKDGVLCSVLGEMLHVVPVVSQEAWDVQTAPGRWRKTSGKQRQRCVSAALVLYHRGEGLGEKVVVLQAGVKGITNSGSSTGKRYGKISLINHLLSGHTHIEALYVCPTSRFRPFVTHRL